MMTNMIAVKGGNAQTMSSRVIAELADARHNDVVATIGRLFDKGLLRSSRKTRQEATGGRPTDVYDLIERDVYLVISGYSDEIRARIVDRWQELEAQQPKFDPATLTRMDILRLAMDAEERCVKAEVERDHAIATKAQIGNRREATAMATASTYKLEAERLKDRLGINTRHATVKSVEKLTGNKYPWLPLRKWCEVNNGVALDVPDPLYGHVKSWPRDAWGEVYAIDLIELFADQAGVA
jgi:phage regulator Rha-like protein